MTCPIYADGSYLEKTGGTWHLEDSLVKARWIREMLQRTPQIKPATVCEIGCGAGGILSDLEKTISNASFVGYEVSPQAYQMCRRFVTTRCSFVLGDAFADGRTYDLVLIMDVVEHIEDCFSFLRQAKAKGRYKIYNIPLDTSASFTLRGFNQWDDYGHIHLFTLETALKSLEYSGHKVLDWKFAPSSFERQTKSLKTNLMNAARATIGSVNQKLAARVLGGYSVLVTAE